MACDDSRALELLASLTASMPRARLIASPTATTRSHTSPPRRRDATLAVRSIPGRVLAPFTMAQLPPLGLAQAAPADGGGVMIADVELATGKIAFYIQSP